MIDYDIYKKLQPRDRKRAIKLVKKCKQMPLLYKIVGVVQRRVIENKTGENPYDSILGRILRADDDGFFWVNMFFASWSKYLKHEREKKWT